MLTLIITMLQTWMFEKDLREHPGLLAGPKGILYELFAIPGVSKPYGSNNAPEVGDVTNTPANNGDEFFRDVANLLGLR